MISAFISQYGLTIMYAILTAVAGVIGTWIGKQYKKYVDDKTKHDVVRTCCKAVEQIYTDLHGQEKYDEAVNSIVLMLAEKNISITDLEIKMLIEATCNEFSKRVKEEIKDDNDEFAVEG